jgi:hypothetical protein
VPRQYYVKRVRLFQLAVIGRGSSLFGASGACDEGIGQNPAMSPTDPSADGNDREVLGSLPKTRPERRSAKRDRPVRAARATAGVAPGTPAGAKRTAAKPAAVAGKKPAAGAKRPKAAAGKTAARAKIGADAKAPARSRPAPASGAAKPVPPAGYAAPKAGRPGGGPGDLMGTAVQAAGELAEIGATLAGQALRSALRRLPRP